MIWNIVKEMSKRHTSTFNAQLLNPHTSFFSLSDQDNLKSLFSRFIRLNLEFL